MNLMDNVPKHIPCLASKLMDPRVHSSSNRLPVSHRPVEQLVEEENHFSHNFSFNKNLHNNDSWKEREYRPQPGNSLHGHKSKIKSWHSRERSAPYANSGGGSSYSKERYSQYHPRPVKPPRPSFDSQHSSKNRDFNYNEKNEWSSPMRPRSTSRASSGSGLSASSSRSNPIAKLLPNVSELSKAFGAGANYFDGYSQDAIDFNSKDAISSPASIWDNKDNAGYGEDETSPMDVDEINEEDIMMDIREIREQMRHDPPAQWNEISDLSNMDKFQDINPQEKKICVVLDTNVFLTDFPFLETLQQSLKDIGCNFILLVPWMVLQELDILKNKNYKLNNSVYRRVQACLAYVYNQLSNSTSNFQGQSKPEANLFNKSSPKDLNDDQILHCCCQYSKKGNYAVVLYSNDKNLCSKAIVSNISAYTRKNIVDGVFLTVNKLGGGNEPLDKKETSPSNISYNANTLGKIAAIKRDMEEIVKQQLSKILETEMMKVYDNLWIKVISIKPPWNLTDIFLCLKKHWIAIFGFILRKCDKDTLENLVTNKKGNSEFTDIYKLNDFIDNVISLLIGFQKHSNYGGTVSESLDQLYSFRAACHKLTTETQEFPTNSLNVNYLDSSLVPNSNPQMPPRRPLSATYNECNSLTRSSSIEKEDTVLNKQTNRPKRSYLNEFEGREGQAILNKKKVRKDPSSSPYRVADRKQQFSSREKNSYYQPSETDTTPDLSDRLYHSRRPSGDRASIPHGAESRLLAEMPKIELPQTKKQKPNSHRSAVEPSLSYQRSEVEPSSSYRMSAVEPSSSYRTSAVEPSSSYQRLTVEPSSSYRASAVEPSSSYQRSAVEPLSSYRRSAVEPSSSHRRSAVEPSSSYQRSAVEPSPSCQRSTTAVLPYNRSFDVLKMFESVWETINHFCGLLCDTFKIPHEIHYARPLEMPRLDEAQSFLPRIYPQINRMCKELRSIVNADGNQNDYREACTLLYNSLVTFYSNLDIKDDEGPEGMLTPEMIIAFCANENKSLLKRGLIQINEYREYLFQCLKMTRRT